ncbi:MAG: contractile injection system tape measure protein, partial [Cyclobacteriaceae bacterium]
MSRHLIRSFNVEIDSDSEARGHRLNKQLNDYLLSEIIPELDRIMDDMAGGRDLWQLDNVVLDLGECTGDQFNDEFKNRLLFRFRQALRSSLNGIPSEESEVAEKSDAPQSRMALLRHYLKHGTLPWWATEAGDDELAELGASPGEAISIDNLIGRMLLEEPDQLHKVLRSMIPATAIRQRLIRQLDDVRLKELTVSMDSSSREISPLIDNILTVSKAMTQSGAANDYREQLWEEVFNTFIIKNESAATAKVRLTHNWFRTILRKSRSGPVETAGKLRKVLAEERSKVRDTDKDVWHSLQKQTEEYFIGELPPNWRRINSDKNAIVDSLDTTKVAGLLGSGKANQESYLPAFFSDIANRLSQSSRRKFTRFILDLVFGNRYGRISKPEILVETVLFFANQLSMAGEDIVRYLSSQVTIQQVQKWTAAGSVSSSEQVKLMATDEAEDETDWTKWKNQDLITSFLLHGVIPWSERQKVKEESLERIFLEWAEKDPAGFENTLRRIDWKQRPFVVKRILATFSPELADRILEQLPRTVASLISPPPLSLETLLASPHIASHYLSLAARNIKWSPMEWQPGLTIPVLLREYFSQKPDELRMILEAFPTVWVRQLSEKISAESLTAEDRKQNIESVLSTEEVQAVFRDLIQNPPDTSITDKQAVADNLVSQVGPAQLAAWKSEVKEFIQQGHTVSPDTIDYKLQHILAQDPLIFIRSVQSIVPSGNAVRKWIGLLSETTLSRLMYQLAGGSYRQSVSLANQVAQLSGIRVSGSMKYNRWYPLFSYYVSAQSRTFSPFHYIISALDHLGPSKEETLRLLSSIYTTGQPAEIRSDLRRLAGLVSATQDISQAIDRFVKGHEVSSASLPAEFEISDPETISQAQQVTPSVGENGKVSESSGEPDKSGSTSAERSQEPLADNSERSKNESKPSEAGQDETHSDKIESERYNQSAETEVQGREEIRPENDESTGAREDKDEATQDKFRSSGPDDNDKISEPEKADATRPEKNEIIEKDKTEEESHKGSAQKQKDDITREEPIPEPPEKEPMFINNAGLVILHPFITRLFSTLGLTENKQFKDQDAAHRAAHVLHYLVYHHTDGQEHEMTLEKVLCSIPLGVPLKMDIELTDEEKDTCISLTKAAINYWDIIKKSSVDNFRASFLIREGAIY